MAEKMYYHFRIDNPMTTENRGDYWACRHDVFNVTGYGSTADEAELREGKLVEAIVQQMATDKGLEYVRRTFEKMSLRYDLVDEKPTIRALVFA